MINHIYQLVSPENFSIKYEDINILKNVIVKPLYMAICQADQRYYMGKRNIKALRKKLPMALIHEAMGEVIFDPTGKFTFGQKVVMVPNIPADEKNSIIYENYQYGSRFMSSGIDGFMREFVSIPADRIVPFEKIDYKVAAITEFVSVGVHAVKRFEKISHNIKNIIGIWGDGSLGYVVSCILKQKFPQSEIVVIGKDPYKLSQFIYADKTFISDDVPNDFYVDHAFECAGGNGSYYAIKDIIKYINPQGTIMLLGVTENEVPINTRDVLEKGLTLIGSSRSGKEDFEEAVKFLKIPSFQNKISKIIYEDSPVENISDMHRIFKTDLNTPFKTVFKWNI